MGKWHFTTLLFILVVSTSSANGFAQRRSILLLDDYRLDQPVVDCYDRETMPHTAIVDSHLHFRHFVVDRAPPFEDVVGYLKEHGVLFANIYGIGQVIPATSNCRTLSSCRRTPIRPSFRNDIMNAENLIKWRRSNGRNKNQDVHLVLSMTFPDLSDPVSVLEGIHFLDREYSEGMFSWMGEVNLVKEEFFNRRVRPVPKTTIPEWEPFMAVLRERDIPLAIHSDLGNNNNNTKYISWMDEVLRLYPYNKIVWVHAGLSNTLTQMNVDEHIEVMSSFLDRFDQLTLDFSWSILDEYYFKNPTYQDKYIHFINQYPTRILPGTDFVATDSRDTSSYLSELEKTSRIYQYVSDEAFRNIALGENYFQLLNLPFQAPPICQEEEL